MSPARFLTLALLLALPALRAAPPSHIYLTWQADTATTLTVTFHTAEEMPGAVVRYDFVSHAADPSAYRHSAPVAAVHRIPGVKNKWIHVAELRDLPPGGDVHFTAGHPDHGFTPERKARTIPADATRIRFAQGGDFGTSRVGPLLSAAAGFEPHFAALGGDIAYANDSLSNAPLWEEWLRLWCKHMVTPAGYTVPMVLAIGNHEVAGGWNQKPDKALFYFALFHQGFGEVAYGAKRFGRDLVFLCLDSDHTAPSDGKQKAFIEASLREHAAVKFKMAMYHVPMFPSHRKYADTGNKLREHWLPLFDSLGLSCAWGNHDHTYKRTHLLRGGKPDPTGIPYFGDGCWGRAVRSVDESREYLLKTASIQHYWICDILPTHFEARAADHRGRVFDVYPDDQPDAAAAQSLLEQIKSGASNPDPVAALLPPREKPGAGLACSVHPGTFATLEALSGAPSLKTLTRLQITPRTDPAPVTVGLVYSGFLDIPAGGDHHFWLTTDGLARLRISGLTVAEKAAPGGVSAKTGHLRLEPGLHPFRLEYAAAPNGGLLSLDWSASGGERQPLPAAVLRHETEPARVKHAEITAAEDAEEDLKTGRVELDSSDLELVHDKAEQVVALRFTGVDIPAGARVRGAFLQFTADEVNDEPCSLQIEGATDAAAFAKQPNNLSSRARTAAKVKSNPGPWSPRDSGSTQRTPNLAPIWAELTAAPGWKAGQPVVLLITGKGKRVASAVPAKAAVGTRLILDWEE